MADDIQKEDIDPWFVTWKLGDQFLDTVRTYAEEINLGAGTTIFSAGDASDAMYLVLEGMVLVLTHDENGQEHTVSIISEGQSFGEIGLLVKQPHSATTAAGMDVRLLKITETSLKKLEDAKPEIMMQIYKVLATSLAEQWMMVTQSNRGSQTE